MELMLHLENIIRIEKVRELDKQGVKNIYYAKESAVKKNSTIVCKNTIRPNSLIIIYFYIE